MVTKYTLGRGISMKISKLLIATTLTGAMLASLVGCGSGNDSAGTGDTSTKKEDTSAKKENVEVNVLQFKVEAAEGFQQAADEYMKLNPNVKINIETVGGGAKYGSSLKAKFQSGSEPTIFNIGGPQDVIDWSEKLEDLTAEPWVNQTLEGLLGGVTMDEKVYGMPFAVEGYGYIYNTAIFKDAGIDVAQIKDLASMDKAFADLDAKIKSGELKDKYPALEAVFELPGKETWVTGLHSLNAVLNQEFKTSLDALKSQSLAFTHADAFKKMIDMQMKYTSNAKTPEKLNAVDYATQVDQGLAIERVAVIQQGNWVYNAVANTDPEVADKLAILPMPVEGGQEGTIPVGVPMYWAVNKDKTDAEKAAAKDFLNWMYTSEEGKDIIVNKCFFIPAFKGYENFPAKDSLGREVMRYMTDGKTTPWIFMGYPTAWGEDVVGANLQKYFAGQMTWEQLVKDATAKWTEMR